MHYLGFNDMVYRIFIIGQIQYIKSCKICKNCKKKKMVMRNTILILTSLILFERTFHKKLIRTKSSV